MKGRIALRFFIGSDQLLDRVHERLGNESSTIRPEVPRRVRLQVQFVCFYFAHSVVSELVVRPPEAEVRRLGFECRSYYKLPPKGRTTNCVFRSQSAHWLAPPSPLNLPGCP